MRSLYILASVILLLPSGLWAQATPPIAASQFDVSRLMESLPEATMKKLRSAPERFVEDAAMLIVGFGAEAGLDLAGIERFVALERARTRARETSQLLRADLDNDQVITRAELGALIATQSATLRGRYLLGFRGADLDKDDRVDMAELRGFAQMRAMARLSVDDAAILRAFMGFDLDQDGFVMLDEVILVVRAFQQEA